MHPIDIKPKLNRVLRSVVGAKCNIMFGLKVFCIFSASFFVTFGLECGINLHGSEEQFRTLTNQCTVGNKSVVTDKPRTSSEEDDEENENSK